jgi:hypothetical protein
MSRPLPRYQPDTDPNKHSRSTVSHTRRPRIEVDYYPADQGNTNPTPHRLFTPNPEDLRGIPCIARGVGGTQPHTNPLAETIRRNR